MRAVVFLLVLGNLIFFAYARGYFGSPASPDRERLAQQLSPENVLIVGRGEAPALAATSAPAPTASPVPAVVTPETDAAERCLAWPALGAKEVETVAAAVAARAPGSPLVREAMKQPAERFLVRIVGLASKAAAEKKAGEVRKMGIEDFEVVADGEQWAVALGLYSTAESAENRLSALRKQGVRSAIVQPKAVVLERTRLRWQGPAAVAAELRGTLAQNPAGECDAPATPAAPAGKAAAPVAANGSGGKRAP